MVYNFCHAAVLYVSLRLDNYVLCARQNSFYTFIPNFPASRAFLVLSLETVFSYLTKVFHLGLRECFRRFEN